MAETTTTVVNAAKLYLKDGEGNDVNFRFSDVSTALDIETVKTACQTFAENGDIFVTAPTTAVRAEIIRTTTETVREDIDPVDPDGTQAARAALAAEEEESPAVLDPTAPEADA